MKLTSFVGGLVPLSSISGFAQVNKSNLVGLVHDPAGAVVPGATIRLINRGTGATREEVSDITGLYRFTLVDHGMNRIEAEQPGFKKFVRDGVQLLTGETITVDLVLEIGSLSESVTINAEATLLRTETGALGTSVNTQVINELPLIGRNPYVFLTLSPGIQYTGSPGALNPWDVFGPSDFTSSGSEARSEFLLDGSFSCAMAGITGVIPVPRSMANAAVRPETRPMDKTSSRGATSLLASARRGS